MKNPADNILNLISKMNEVAAFNPLEARIVKLSIEMFPMMLTYTRIIPGQAGPSSLTPITPELVTQAMRLSVNAAVAMDTEIKSVKESLRKKEDA